MRALGRLAWLMLFTGGAYWIGKRGMDGAVADIKSCCAGASAELSEEETAEDEESLADILAQAQEHEADEILLQLRPVASLIAWKKDGATEFEASVGSEKVQALLDELSWRIDNAMEEREAPGFMEDLRTASVIIPPIDDGLPAFEVHVVTLGSRYADATLSLAVNLTEA